MVSGQGIPTTVGGLARIVVAKVCRRFAAAAVLAVLSTFLVAVAGAPAQARYAAIVVDVEGGRVLYGRNIDRRLYPASLTKIMTLYLTFEALDQGGLVMRQRLKVSRRAAGQTPTTLGLKRAQTVTVEDMILAVVTRSANDAATVLAEAVAGTEVQFAQLMTERARQLGMIRTTFRNATGLPNRRQRTSARDMAKLAMALIRKYPSYYRYFSTEQFTWGKQTHRNTNQLLYSYAGTDGIKTGYIRASGFNLVASAERGGHRLIGVIFGGRTARSRDRRMVQLLETGFNQIAALDATEMRPADRPTAPRLTPPPPKPKPWRPAVTQHLPKPRPWRSVITRPLPKPKPWRGAQGQRKLAPKPADPTGWSVQVGVFHDLARAQRAAYRAAAASRILAKRRIRFDRRARDDGVVYRARLTGLNETEASQACRSLRRRQMACVIVLPNGDIRVELARH